MSDVYNIRIYLYNLSNTLNSMNIADVWGDQQTYSKIVDYWENNGYPYIWVNNLHPDNAEL